jgi:glycosyltransferase involved in cell wall biosynthesis
LLDWSCVDEAIVVSQYMKRRLLDLAGSVPSRLTVVNNGVDLERFLPVQRDFRYRIGMACSTIPRKRVYEAILCLSEIRQKGYPFVLYIAGEPDDKRTPLYGPALSYLIKKLDLTSAVVFHGYVEDMPRWYRSIDVFLSNSYWEGQQVALLEAMASGCHCLAHFWGGVEEILPVENTFVTNGELQNKLLVYADQDENERRKSQAYMRAIAERDFGEKQMVQRVLELIDLWRF